MRATFIKQGEGAPQAERDSNGEKTSCKRSLGERGVTIQQLRTEYAELVQKKFEELFRQGRELILRDAAAVAVLRHIVYDFLGVLWEEESRYKNSFLLGIAEQDKVRALGEYKEFLSWAESHRKKLDEARAELRVLQLLDEVQSELIL